MKAIKFIILLLIGLNSYAQGDSCNLKISLLTCGPGADLYSIWGHTAIRVVEKNTGRNLVFNYGTFDFDDPDFYTKFTRGKLLYFVSISSYTNFLYEYQYEGRSVIEQELNLNCGEKQKLSEALHVNTKEENKYYSYDFALDNCSTRPRDVIINNSNDSVNFKNIFPDPIPSYRDLIHENLDKYHQPWSKFGIDLILGRRLDHRPSNVDAMFLPYYVMKGFDSATVNNKPLVSSKKIILNERSQ